MSFTKKHYEETARIVRETFAASDAIRAGHCTPAVLRDASGVARSFHAIGVAHGARNIADSLSRMLASDNPRFDAERFAKACEPGSGK